MGIDPPTKYFLGLVGIMILAGILGAYCRKIFDSQERGPQQNASARDPGLFVTVVPGIVAAFLVPLFLSIGKSDVFSNALAGKDYAENTFIIFAFCLLAAISAPNFVNAMVRQALQKAEEAEAKADEAEKKADKANKKITEVAELTSEEPRVAASLSVPQAARAGIAGSEQERLVWHALGSKLINFSDPTIRS